MSFSDSSTDSSSSTKQSAQSDPWAAAIPQLKDWLAGLAPSTKAAGTPNATTTGALNDLITQAKGGDPNAAAVNTVAQGQLGYSTQPAQDANTAALGQYKASQADVANGNNQDLSKNPYLQDALGSIMKTISSNVNSQFAGSGRDGSGANQQSLATGFTSAAAPLLLQEFNTQQARTDAANRGILDATTANGNTNAGLATTQGNINNSGISSEKAALDAKQWGPEQVAQLSQTLQNLPVDQLSQIAAVLFPAAQLGGQSTGKKTGTSSSDTMSFGFKL